MQTNVEIKSYWIFSKKFDLTIFLVPLLMAVLITPLALFKDYKEMPLWAFVAFIVSFDVAHVWATIYRSYLDKDEFRRRRLLYLLPIPIFLLLSFRLHNYSATLFWTILAYVAIYHFIKQNYGYLTFYKKRLQENSSFDYYLDKWTLWAGALGPVLFWHSTPKRQFDWFDAGESFIIHINPSFLPDITAIYFIFISLYISRQIYLFVKKNHWNPGKQMIMSAHFLTWAVGIGFTDNPMISAAFLNLFHGIPFIATVWYFSNQKYQNNIVNTPGKIKKPHNSFLAFLSQKKNWFIFYGLLLFIALIEEGMWDTFVWQRYIPETFLNMVPEISTFALSIWVAILSLPQIMHYFLDGWIWRFNNTNEELEKYFK